MCGFPLPSPPVPARPPPRPAAPRRPPAAEGGTEGGREPAVRPCSASAPLSGSGPRGSAGAGSRAGGRRRPSPCRGHGAQPAAPFRGREWGRQGGMEGARQRRAGTGPAEAAASMAAGPGRAGWPGRARGGKGRAALPVRPGAVPAPAPGAEAGAGGLGQRWATRGKAGVRERLRELRPTHTGS